MKKKSFSNNYNAEQYLLLHHNVSNLLFTGVGKRSVFNQLVANYKRQKFVSY